MMEHVDAMVAALYMQRQSVMCILQSRLKQTVQDQKARKQSMQAEGRGGQKKLLAVVLFILTRLLLSNTSRSVHTHKCTCLHA